MNLDELEKIALEGNVKLQYQLGVLFQVGEEVEKDYKKALKYFKMAAENDNTDAQCELGNMYCTGDGVEKDYKEGFKWFKLASIKNNDFAQGNIGFMYENGYGVEKNYKEAFKYYMMSARNGNTVAQRTVANMYKNGFGVDKNIEEANKWLKIADDREKIEKISEDNNLELKTELYDKILIKCKKGDRLVEENKYNEAIETYLEALELIPNPKYKWEASTWIYTALGDTYFDMKKYNEAKKYLFDALSCPNGVSNPFILLRLGETLYKLGDVNKSKEYLIKAYMIEGEEIFENEDKEYFKVIEKLI